VCTLLRAHASQTSTKRAGDSAQAQRKGAQRPACVHLCARALLQRFPLVQIVQFDLQGAKKISPFNPEFLFKKAFRVFTYY
jgi:hypothetical protein